MSQSPKHVLISGASGVVGRHLGQILSEKEIPFSVFSYGSESVPGANQTLRWDPRLIVDEKKSELSSFLECMSHCDVIVNLSGSSITQGRMGSSHQKELFNSRTDSVNALLKLMGFCDTPPSLWIQASAAGFYGDTGDQFVDEKTSCGDLILSGICLEWERTLLEGIQQLSTQPRIVIGRLGLVLAQDAPAWKKMLMPIKLGIAGPLGPGTQWWSWIHADDLASIFYRFMTHTDMMGVYNVASPYPVQQRTFTQSVAKKCSRPAVLPVPSWALKLVLGGVATELLLPSSRIQPDKLLEHGFKFKYETLESVLDVMLQ